MIKPYIVLMEEKTAKMLKCELPRLVQPSYSGRVLGAAQELMQMQVQVKSGSGSWCWDYVSAGRVLGRNLKLWCVRGRR